MLGHRLSAGKCPHHLRQAPEARRVDRPPVHRPIQRDGREKPGVTVIGTLSRMGKTVVLRLIADLSVEKTGENDVFGRRTGLPNRGSSVSLGSRQPSDDRSEGQASVQRIAAIGNDGGVPRRSQSKPMKGDSTETQ